MAKKNLLIDATILGSSMECLEKYRLSHVQHLRPVRIIPGIENGNMCHAFCEHFYKCRMEGIDFETSVKESCDKAMEATLSHESVSQEDVEWGIKCLVDYAHFWRYDDWTPLAVEQPFISPFFETEAYNVFVTGKIDLYTNTKTLQGVPADHKFYSRWHEPLRSDVQFLIYSIVTKSNYLIVNRIGTQKTVEDKDKFRRIILPYEEAYRENEKKNLIVHAKALIEALELESFPKNRKMCGNFGGCWYKDLCNTYDETTFNFVAQTRFKVVEAWDVTKILEKV